MRTSQQIRTEISEAESRLQSIEQELESAQQAEEAAREAVTNGSGDMKTLERAITATSARVSVQGTLASRIESLGVELAASAASEAHQELLQKAATLAADAEKSWAEYSDAYAKAMAEYPQLAAAIVSAQESHWQTRCAFAALPDTSGLLRELEAQGIATDGLRAVPLDSRAFPFSNGSDLRDFQGKAEPALTSMLFILHRERAKPT